MPTERRRGGKARTKRGRKAVPLISATEPDWSREHKKFFEWAPSRSLLAAIRSYQRWDGRWGLAGFAMRKWAIARHRFWSIVTGCDIPVTARIGGGLLLPHPNGVVLADVPAGTVAVGIPARTPGRVPVEQADFAA